MIVSEFERTGVVVVPGLVSGEALEAARAAKVEGSLSELYKTLSFYAWKREFEAIALRSGLTAAARQLGNSRLLVDAYFALADGNEGCGWHVDDDFFWPCDRSYATGVNAWVALDNITDGGGLAVAPGSDTFEDTREVIRGRFENGTTRTCHMKAIAPDHVARLEAIKLVPKMQPGDAILHKRYIFHRADPITSVGSPPVARYSARYVPDDVVLDGWRLDPDTFARVTVKDHPIGEADPNIYPPIDGHCSFL
ncbi:hypothetical protein CTAYLR_006528 [Chrysophaeum taylorii]|uniref:Phytanoyl-CoA dioxygenase n=1 Tax=Chrysophaeum taylorii TaxID=2483200 RepID=A0AAD7UG60_9STRA|nr:hypothetical protein CTAYLR_006528 [Chrysophaeum taylorii]